MPTCTNQKREAFVHEVEQHTPDGFVMSGEAGGNVTLGTCSSNMLVN
jgi:hypothetical protein